MSCETWHTDKLLLLCNVRALWNKFVAPRIECNVYRKWSVVLHTIGELSSNSAVVARALARVARKPPLVWMLLSQNHDVLSSYLDEALTRDNSVSIT
jgi:hypothetical protein